MTHFKFAFFVILTLLFSTLSVPAAEWQKSYDYTQVRQNFGQPPLWYAPHTFWFWDAPLDSGLTASMAAEMTRQRLNPGYAHPRHSGAPNKPFASLPKKQWLSPLWFQSFDAALTQAEKAGMTLGYCDEYWWPSGQAAGRVLQQHPELEAQSLQWQRREIAGPGTVAIPACTFSVVAKLSQDGRIMPATLHLIDGGHTSWQAAKGKWVVYSYSLTHHTGTDGGQVNYLDNRLMDVFLPIAHESYANYFCDKMGTSIPGVFVDNEGDYGWKMAWSDYLAERYRELKGRDIRLWLPLLTEKDADGLWAKARCDWFDVVSEVYTNQFLGRVNDWLGEQNMYYISNLWEESLMLQTRAVGDFMRAQRRVTLPGNDCLQMKSQQVHDFKETQSVCEFENRPFMSELMGVAGWEMTPAQMKMTLNSVTAFGVTHTVPHGINLNRTLETIPYPPDWFTENPYWRYLHLWTDFARRASFVNRQGRLVADVLLYNPLKSIWALSEGYFTSELGDEWPAQAVNINTVYSAAMSAMTAAHLDYLIADDYYMNQAVVKPSETASLRIGEHEFSVLALPPLFLLPRATADKILDFARAGGVVLLLGELPQGSPEAGANDPLIVQKMQQLRALPSVIDLSRAKNKQSRLVKEINSAGAPQIIATGRVDATLFTSHRKIDDTDFYWLANNSSVAKDIDFAFRDGAGRAELWNCETGGITPVAYKIINGRKSLALTLQPYEALWLVFDADKKPFAALRQADVTAKEIQLTAPRLSFPETKTIRASSARSLIVAEDEAPQGILTVDFDDSSWPWMNILGPVRLEEPWRAAMLFDPEPESTRYYRDEFDLPNKADGALINLNADNSVRFWVNGTPVAPGPHSNSWENVDQHDIAAMLRKGKNVIAVELTNHVGYGWLLMQGVVKLANGSSVDILSNADWKESQTAAPGWQGLQFDDSNWSMAQVAPPEIADKDMRTMKRPQIAAFSKATVWRRLAVPPTATRVRLPGLSPQAKIWVDGKSVAARNEEIELSGARMLVIKSRAGQNGLSTPAAFACEGSQPGRFGSWLELGLRRFTGFMDYEMTFDAAEHRTATLDLDKVLYMAEVWVNDVHVGERLWPPFEFDLSPALRAGKNNIRVRVGNVTANEMGLKDDLGELRHWGWQGAPPDSCFDAGLFGPVRVLLK